MSGLVAGLLPFQRRVEDAESVSDTVLQIQSILIFVDTGGTQTQSESGTVEISFVNKMAIPQEQFTSTCLSHTREPREGFPGP